VAALRSHAKSAKLTSVERVAFLGLGTMGTPMAANIARAGIPLVVHNRTPGRARGVVALGATEAATARDAVEVSDVVVTMLTGAEALDEVLFGTQGAALGEIAGKLFVDMSTIGPAAAKLLSTRLRASGASFVDAPVSGSRAPAEKGELLVLAGGTRDDLTRLERVFAAVATRAIHAGPVGAGQTLKIVYNGLGCQHLVAFACMLRLGERAGLARQVLVDAFTGGAFATPAYVGKRERVLSRRYADPDFVLELVLRDAVLCADLQRELGFELDTHAAARREVERAVAAGLGSLDLFAVERVYDDGSGA
jgi:3-hydroxyisobutyrate dehydrogenase-like beta-hydroxyacid dehydrogenase